MLCCQRLVSYLMQCWTSILHQTISTTRGVRDQPGVIDVWIKLQVSRKPCFHTGPDMNNESTTNETQQHWPHSDRPAVRWALIHAFAFIHFFISICCQIRSDLMYLQGTISGHITPQSQQKNKQTGQILDNRVQCVDCMSINQTKIAICTSSVNKRWFLNLKEH